VGHIRFAGVQGGVLAVHAVKDLPFSVPWRPRHPLFGRWDEKRHDFRSPEASDPAVIEAVVDVLKFDPVGWAYRRQEHLRECQALLRGSVKL
jgi:hypothetical protein